MKTSSIFVPGVLSLLASVSQARPRALEGDPLPQSSTITAFVIAADGTPSVECWEVTNMVMVKDQKIQRLDGSVGTARVVPLADSELDGLDILTWPAYSPIWPVLDNKESEDVHSEWFDLSAFNNLFSIQGGLINFNLNFRFSSTNVDEQEQWIFDLENGDDWFYFEDNYSQSSLAKSVDAPAPPFTISTISGTETEVIRLRFKTQPQHKVLHKGACSFSGIRVPEQGSRMPISRVRNSLVHQYRQDA